MDIISNRTWKGRNDLHGQRTVRLDPYNLVKVEIRRNAYDEQSWARSFLWSDTNGWLPLVSTPIDFWSIKHFSYVAKDGTWEDSMMSSLDNLLAESVALLGDKWSVTR